MFCNWCWCTDDVDEWNENNSTHAEYIDERIGNEDSCTHDIEEDVDDELESVISHHTSFSDDEVYADYECLNQWGKNIHLWENAFLHFNTSRNIQFWIFLFTFILLYILMSKSIIWFQGSDISFTDKPSINFQDNNDDSMIFSYYDLIF